MSGGEGREKERGRARLPHGFGLHGGKMVVPGFGWGGRGAREGWVPFCWQPGPGGVPIRFFLEKKNTAPVFVFGEGRVPVLSSGRKSVRTEITQGCTTNPRRGIHGPEGNRAQGAPGPPTVFLVATPPGGGPRRAGETVRVTKVGGLIPVFLQFKGGPPAGPLRRSHGGTHEGIFPQPDNPPANSQGPRKAFPLFFKLGANLEARGVFGGGGGRSVWVLSEGEHPQKKGKAIVVGDRGGAARRVRWRGLPWPVVFP